MNRVLTHHAVERYRKRVDRHATRGQIQAVIDAAQVRRTKPAWVLEGDDHYTDCWLVTPQLAMPTRRDEHDSGSYLVVLTVLKKGPGIDKATRRALREEAREQEGGWSPEMPAVLDGAA